MKKIFTTLFAGLLISAQVTAVSVKDIYGQYDGNLNIGGDLYPNKSVYLLPGVVDSTLTFVLPDFTFGKGKLGNIVVPNIPMDENGMLHLENATLYLDSIAERATITILNGLEDGGTTYNSIISNTDAMVLLSIVAPSLPEPIFVLFMGQAVRANNYTMPNGGFEGAWTNNEPEGWHSFGTAAGEFINFVNGNTDQFVPSTQVRPGSNGTQSALLSSKMVLGSVPANGNCTNGQINAGSKTADDPKNFNFSDPANTGFNTPFHGHPDSLVFWAKYLPADRNAANEVNKARTSVIITSDARYQDPEGATDYSDVVIARATVNYAATNEFGWQRISVPFEYQAASMEHAPAYILATFTTNMTPGGGSSYSTGTINKVNVLDTLYLDDVEMVYNRKLGELTRDGAALSFDANIASVAETYCDSCSKYVAETEGNTTRSFIAFDPAHKCIFVYVIAEDYAQSGRYNVYRVDFTDTNAEGTSIDTNEAIENIFTAEPALKVQKVLYNGRLLIRRGEVWYNVSGVRVK